MAIAGEVVEQGAKAAVDLAGTFFTKMTKKYGPKAPKLARPLKKLVSKQINASNGSVVPDLEKMWGQVADGNYDSLDSWVQNVSASGKYQDEVAAATNAVKPGKKTIPRDAHKSVSTETRTKEVTGQTSQDYTETALPGEPGQTTRHGSELSPRQKRAATHHIYGLSDDAVDLKNDPDFEEIISYGRRRYGTISGDDTRNYITMFDVLSKGTRRDRIQQIYELYPDLPVHARKSLNDNLGSGRFKDVPLDTDLAEENVKFKKFRSQIAEYGDPDAAGLPEDILPDKLPGGKGEWPDLTLVNEDGTKFVHKFSSADDWIENKWKVFNKHYGTNVSAKKIGKIKVDPNLDMYSPDHAHVHEMLKKGHRLQEYKAAFKDGSWYKKTIDEKAKLRHLVQLEQRTVAENMAQYRYDKIAEHYKKWVGGDFKRIPLTEQREYMMDNINDVANLGGWHRLPKEKAMFTQNPDIDRDALKVLFNLQSNSGQWQEKLGMSPDQWNDMIRRFNDPADPAGNYTSPGGDTVNISDRD